LPVRQARRGRSPGAADVRALDHGAAARALRAAAAGGSAMTTAAPSPTSSPSSSGTEAIEHRIAQRRPRVHILTGAVCNNNCIFCMEEDREGRYVTNSATTDETVRWILAQHERYEEVCFTSGEPTTNRRLHHWVKLARDAGAQWVSMMTNGRALAHEGYAKRL